MEIHVAPILLNLFIIGLFYSINWLFYRFLLYPNNRWEQKSNVCYDNAMYFASGLTGVFYTLFVLFYYADLEFVW